MLRRVLILTITLSLIFSGNFLCAEEVERSPRGFSLSPSQDWIELPLPFQGVVVSYGKKGTTATFHITERDLSKTQRIEELNWEDLFSPEFESIDVRVENMTALAGEKAKFCVYTLKPGNFKKTMEGELPGKYMNYVLIHNGKLYSITFKDTENDFALTYPSFLAAIRTLQFDVAMPQVAKEEL